MHARVWSDADRALADTLRAPPRSAIAPSDAALLLDRAERHGCTGVVLDALREAGAALEPKLDAEIGKRMVARELDQAAHIGMLRNVDRALSTAKLRGVALKGALLGERFYKRPSARSTSDIDLLVEEQALEASIAALRAAGYEPSDDPSEARFRAEHHHLHLYHPSSAPLELHFHAYKGFGRVLPSEPLIERSVAAPRGFAALRVLETADELVYLAVHAAAHRFVRLGWLYDLKLLVDRAEDGDLVTARRRAESWGFARPVAYAGLLLDDVFAVARAKELVTPRLGRLRRGILARVSREPEDPVARSFTRFIYTTALCDSAAAAARYARLSTVDHARRILERVS